MARAQERDAVARQRFYFRKNVHIQGSKPSSTCSSPCSTPSSPLPCGKSKKVMQNCFSPLPEPENGLTLGPVEEEYEEMTMDEIINGKVGLIPLTRVAVLIKRQGRL